MVHGHDLELTMNVFDENELGLVGSLEANDGDDVMPLDIGASISVGYEIKTHKVKLFTPNQAISIMHSQTWVAEKKSLGKLEISMMTKMMITMIMKLGGWNTIIVSGKATISAETTDITAHTITIAIMGLMIGGSTVNTQMIDTIAQMILVKLRLGICSSNTHFEDGTSPTQNEDNHSHDDEYDGEVHDDVESHTGSFSTATTFEFELTDSC